MRMTAAFRVSSRTSEVKAAGEGFAMEFSEIVASEGAKEAKRNVAPGVGVDGYGGGGPGPHPHRTPHIDFGDLMRDISWRVRRQGFLTVGEVFTELDYGLYLEMGWTAPSGMHYRYPWLYPAIVIVTNEWRTIARSTSDRWFNDGGGNWKIGTPLSSTLLPE